MKIEVIRASEFAVAYPQRQRDRKARAKIVKSAADTAAKTLVLRDQLDRDWAETFTDEERAQIRQTAQDAIATLTEIIRLTAEGAS